MEQIRKPFQGVLNIVRFNWHFYVLAASAVFLIIMFEPLLPAGYSIIATLTGSLIALMTLTSLVVSFYIYDLSDLYQFKWVHELSINKSSKIINVSAGFDEFGSWFKTHFKDVEFKEYDFYNPLLNSEISIKRARKAYPPSAEIIQFESSKLPENDKAADYIIVVFAAHELRLESERNIFFYELKRTLKDDGKVIVVEHLRDTFNYIAYNLGAFHFIPRASWFRTFRLTGLSVYKKSKTTFFVTTYILTKDAA